MAFETISPEVASSLQRAEQEGFGSYAIFGEQPNYYSNPDIWQSGGSSTPTYGTVTAFGATIVSTTVYTIRIYYGTTSTTSQSTAPTSSTLNTWATAKSAASTHYAVVLLSGGSTFVEAETPIAIPSTGTLSIYAQQASSAPTAPTGSTPGGSWTTSTITASGTNDIYYVIRTSATGTAATSWFYPAVFEFVSSGISNESTPIIPERISPTRSPIKNQDGQVMVAGDFSMHVHVEDMMLFWKYILMDDAPSCVALTSSDLPSGFTAVDSNKTYYKTTFKNKDPLLPGLTAEIVKGETANVYMGLNISSATLTFTENIDISLTVMGLRGYLRQNLANASATLFSPSTDQGKGTVDFTSVLETKPIEADDVGKFKRLEEDTYKGWGCAVRLYNDDDITGADDTDGKNRHIIPVTDVTLTINHNLEHPPRYWGQRFPRRPTPTAKREITLDATTDFTLEDTFAQDFFENRVYDNCELLILHQPYYELGKQETYQTIVKLGRSQFTSYTDPEVSDQGPLVQTLNFKSLPRTAGASDELEVEIVSPENLSFIVKTGIGKGGDPANEGELGKDPKDRTPGTIGGSGTGFLDATTA